MNRFKPLLPGLLVVACAVACGGGGEEPPVDPEVREVLPWLGQSTDDAPPVSPSGGTPATGPGGRYNLCERIWCLAHGENYFVDHFLAGHAGWILHDDAHGDVFVSRRRRSSPGFPKARTNSLNLCGRHVHPYKLGTRRGSRGAPVRASGYSHALGYGRGHYRAFGTRLDPCCINGLGWGYIHATADRQFRFHALDDFRELPTAGWQKPFPAPTR